MRHPLPRLLGVLLILTGMAWATSPPARAADEPPIARPKTYRYHAEVGLTIEGERATSVADGEYDLERKAFRIVVVTQAGGTTIRIELILLDGRLYGFDPQRNRWEYTILSPEDLAKVLPGPEVPRHPTAGYAQTGTETLGGAQTARWRASGDLNALIPVLTAREFGGAFLQEVITTEVFIGAANSYLYRATIRERGTVIGIGDTPEPAQPVASDIVFDYSDFDRPVTITAPPDAVPAGSRGATPAGGAPAGLLARALPLGTPIAAESLGRLLPIGLPQP